MSFDPRKFLTKQLAKNPEKLIQKVRFLGSENWLHHKIVIKAVIFARFFAKENPVKTPLILALPLTGFSAVKSTISNRAETTASKREKRKFFLFYFPFCLDRNQSRPTSEQRWLRLCLQFFRFPCSSFRCSAQSQSSSWSEPKVRALRGASYSTCRANYREQSECVVNVARGNHGIASIQSFKGRFLVIKLEGRRDASDLNSRGRSFSLVSVSPNALSVFGHVF